MKFGADTARCFAVQLQNKEEVLTSVVRMVFCIATHGCCIMPDQPDVKRASKLLTSYVAACAWFDPDAALSVFEAPNVSEDEFWGKLLE